MKIIVYYYNLKEPKIFNDGSIIEISVTLRKIPPENNKEYYNVETVDTFDFKKIFPVKKTDVELKEVVEEEWSKEMFEQQKKETEEKWFEKND